MSQWYYAHDGKQSGPVPISELQRLASDGKFDPEKDLVWREGQPDWKPASTVPELESLFKKKSPVEPPVAEGSAPASTTPTASYEAPRSEPAPSYQTPSAAPVGAQKSIGLAVASMVCGLLALFSCVLWFVAIPFGIAAIVTGHLASSKIKHDSARFGGRGLALTGLVTGYLGVLLTVLATGFAGYLFLQSPEKLREMGFPQEFIESIEQQRELQEQKMGQ
ncbi:GYF domain-containing protein [Haloferula chungangensis]|uniref:GYF domain-containing protein n=1 Tax=Haloferula chungangensis TaxID=1048331 RepID=A0ABW2L6Z6_9BACT